MSRLTLDRHEPGVTHWNHTSIVTPHNSVLPLNERQDIDTLIISDTHFGTSSTRATALLALLNTFHITRRLILLGDIFHKLNFTHISEEQWQVISHIRTLADPSRPLEEVWVRGNHDNDSIHVFRHFVGLDVKEEVLWEQAGKKYLAIHGDQFDRFVIDFPGLTGLIVRFHEFLLKVDPYHRHIGGWLTRKSGEWRQESQKVAQRAFRYAKERAVDYIIVGHTHKAHREHQDVIEYINTGSWTKNPCSFVTVSDQGPQLHYVQLSE
jgi:UDP-2,3-diacylglucosamine pyrophosphatase LpxH